MGGYTMIIDPVRLVEDAGMFISALSVGVIFLMAIYDAMRGN